MDTITIRKANSILEIPADQKDEYMARGYDVVNTSGVVVEAATPNDVPTLRARLAEVSAENAKLKAQIQALQAAPKRLDPVMEPVEEKEEKPKKTAPKRTTKKS